MSKEWFAFGVTVKIFRAAQNEGNFFDWQIKCKLLKRPLLLIVGKFVS
jgi:hypothetical protein